MILYVIKFIYWLEKTKNIALGQNNFVFQSLILKAKFLHNIWTNFRNSGYSGSFNKSIGRVSFSRFAKKVSPSLWVLWKYEEIRYYSFNKIELISASFLILSIKCIYLLCLIWLCDVIIEWKLHGIGQ